MQMTALVDLSEFSEGVDPTKYKRLRKTYISLVATEVPESFLVKFEDGEAALEELLDAIYGVMECEDDQL